jgi:hypothetical protein
MTTVSIEEEINIGGDDFEDLITAIEKNFGINFQSDEFTKPEISVKDLIQLVSNKIDLQHSNDCTSQQVFYQLRAFFGDEFNIEKTYFTKDLLLEELIPKKIRRKTIIKIENKLDINLDILTIKTWLEFVIIATFFISIYFLFKDFKLGILLLAFFGLLTKIKGNEFRPKTIEDLIDKITKQNYRQLRNKKNSFNPIEIRKIIAKMIEDKLGCNVDEFELETKIKW